MITHININQGQTMTTTYAKRLGVINIITIDSGFGNPIKTNTVDRTDTVIIHGDREVKAGMAVPIDTLGRGGQGHYRIIDVSTGTVEASYTVRYVFSPESRLGFINPGELWDLSVALMGDKELSDDEIDRLRSLIAPKPDTDSHIDKWLAELEAGLSTEGDKRCGQ